MSLFAKEFEAPPEVWGIGRIALGGDHVPWPVSQADVDDEAESMAGFLARLGLDDDGIVLVVAMLSDAIHAVPLEQAAGRVGARYSSADATAADAFRVAYLVRQLQPQVVVGVDRAVLDGLAERDEDPRVLLGDARAVCPAGGDAAARLRAAGLAVVPWWRIGPTSAFELAPGTVVYDDARWDMRLDDGEVVVSSRAPRLTPTHALHTGVRPDRLVPLSAF